MISIGSGSFDEIKPPVLQTPEEVYLSYQVPQKTIKRQSVSTRSQNLTLHFPLNEGQGLTATDSASGYVANLVGGTTWSDGFLGGGLRFNGTDGYLAMDLTAEDLGIGGKRPRTIAFWTKVEGVVANDPGVYG